MRRDLEGFVRYDQSLLWRIGDAYYANRGIAAWTRGDQPFGGTNNAAFARQHAEFFVGVAPAAAPARGPIHVLEIGSGLGHFARGFLDALREDCGAPGRRLSERVTFVVSDIADRIVREALATRALAALAAEGRVVGALFDVRDRTLRGLDGAPLDVAFTMALANYVCDVTPVSVFRKDGGHFHEKYAKVTAEVTDGEPLDGAALARHVLDRSTERGLLKATEIEVEWRPVDLEARLPADHAAALRGLVGGLDRATVAWFGAFLDLVAGLGARMRPGGVLVINDYGGVSTADLDGLRDVVGRPYGNSMSHPVNLSILDAFCPPAGLHALRTRDAFRSVNTGVVVYGTHAAAHDDAFRAAFVDQSPGEDLLDLVAAGREVAKAGKSLLAVRLFRRALGLDPRSVELHYRIGDACLDAGRPAAALDYLSKGLTLDADQRWDFAFHLGRACHRLKRHADSERWYRLSLQREEHPATRFNLALLYRDTGDAVRARAECSEALRQRPAYEHAAKLLAEIDRARGATP